MTAIHLPRKRLYKAHDRKVVFIKGLNESAEHVLMKVFLWALYLPAYPDLTVEVGIGDKYKPDVVQLDTMGKPMFWGESGKVSVDKIESLTRRYRQTHFAIAKWNMRLDPLAETVGAALAKHPHSAPFDLLTFPDDAAERFIRADGTVAIAHEQIAWRRFSPE